MKLPFYLRKSKSYFKDGKYWLEIRMNWFDKFLCLIDLIWRRTNNSDKIFLIISAILFIIGWSWVIVKVIYG